MRSVHVIRSGGAPTATLADGILTISGSYNNTLQPLTLRKLRKLTKTANNTETAQVYTVTITRANNTSYGLSLVQDLTNLGDNNSSVEKVTVVHNSSAAATANSEIVDALVAQINAHGRLRVVAAATSATTFTVTTSAGYPSLVLQKLLNNANISIANTTPGVKANGQGAYLIALKGVENAVSGQAYVTYAGEYVRTLAGKEVEGPSEIVDELEIYVDSTQATLIGDIDKILSGAYLDSTTVATLAGTVDDYVSVP